jgi:hypothetical protein
MSELLKRGVAVQIVRHADRDRYASKTSSAHDRTTNEPALQARPVNLDKECPYADVRDYCVCCRAVNCAWTCVPVGSFGYAPDVWNKAP